MKKRVLVFPCGTEIGLEIYKSTNYSTHFEVFGASSVDDHGAFVYKNYIGGLPFVTDDAFIDALNEVIKQNKIDYVFPAHDDAILQVAWAFKEGKLACGYIGSSLDTCEVARSKQLTYQKLQSVVAVPALYDSVEAISTEAFPVFMKPDKGQGSKGTHVAHTKDEAIFYLAKDQSLLLMEYLPGKEYTIDCFTNTNGQLLFCEGRIRSRISNGISVNSQTVENPRFKDIAEKINQTLKFKGVWFFQLKERDSGELVLMEIASRVAGTMGLVRNKGVNLPLLSLFDAAGITVEILENNYSLTVDRALHSSYKSDFVYTHVYMDLDDALLLDGKVNIQAVAFIYQCLNNNIAVHLITRHRQDLDQTLSHYKLNGLFQNTIWLKDDEAKADYIQEPDAIFIDDSFAERQKVSQKCGIPVFDAHMLESLLEEF